MNRRSFLKLGAAATVGAAVAPMLPPVTPAEINTFAHAPRGLPFFVEDSGSYQAMDFTWDGIPIVTDVDCPVDVGYYFFRTFAVADVEGESWVIKGGTSQPLQPL